MTVLPLVVTRPVVPACGSSYGGRALRYRSVQRAARTVIPSPPPSHRALADRRTPSHGAWGPRRMPLGGRRGPWTATSAPVWGRSLRWARAVRKVGHSGPVPPPDGQGDRSHCYAPRHGAAQSPTQSKTSDDDLKLHFPPKMPRCLSLRLLPCGRMLPRGWGGGVQGGFRGHGNARSLLGALCRGRPLRAAVAQREATVLHPPNVRVAFG